MYVFDPDALHLAREFRNKPFGQRSPALERLLTLMRGAAMVDKYCIVCTEPYRRWLLARLSGVRGVGPTLEPDPVFHRIEDAEWAVFKKRWSQLGGGDLDSRLLADEEGVRP